jgi:hypothetical protein
MHDAGFWPTSAEGWTTLVANSIAILTFAFGRRAFLNYLVSTRRALEALRFAAPSGAVPPEARLPHVNIELERPAPANRWYIHWTVPDGGEPKRAIATINSLRLRWHLRRNRNVRNLPVFGEVRFLDSSEGPQLVEIPAIDYIARGGMYGWLARILFG